MENMTQRPLSPHPVVESLVVAQDGDILLCYLKGKLPLYSLPRRRVERGESIEEASERGLEKEGGLCFEQIECAGVQDEFCDGEHVIVIRCLAKLSRRQAREKVVGASTLWISPKEALDLNLKESNRSFVRWYMEKNFSTRRKIGVNRFVLDCSVGILPHEKKQKQKIFVTVEVEWPPENALLDYREIANLAVTLASKGHFPLIEDLAQALIEALHEHFEVPFAMVTIEKPSAIQGADFAFVELSKRFSL